MVRRHRYRKNTFMNRRSDANAILPETLTDTFIRTINALPSDSIFDTVKVQYLKDVYLSKFVSKETDAPELRKSRAIFKWLCVEQENEATNTRLLITSEEYNILPRVTWSSFISYTQRQIVDLIGETVPTEAILGSFSGGATTTRSRTQSHPALKYLGKAAVTPAARKWFDLVMAESPLWASFSDDLTVVESIGNVMFTVPKSTEIDRCCCKEPDLNMYLQKGVGNHFRKRLRTVGINLNDQTRNQRLAREGSVTGRLATIDLSSASDSISYGIVQLLMPDLWFGLLADLRSPFTFVDGEWHQNHMFSSMGNGFTFELESLIFWALARAVRHFTRGSGVIAVYGDDLIVGSDYAEALEWVLGYFGFTVNRAKSFYSGPFRESCGGHYHDGNDITPFYLRAPLSKIRDAIKMANQIRKWSEIPGLGILDPTLEELWLLLKSVVPSDYWGGSDLGSTEQLVSTDRPYKRLLPVSQKRDNGAGGYLLWLDTCEDSETSRDDAIVTSSRKIASHSYVGRRVKAEVRNPSCIFYSELHRETEALG